MQPLKRRIRNAAAISIAICAMITLVNWVQNPNFILWNFVFSRPMLAGFLTGLFLYLGNTSCFYWIRKLLPQEDLYIRRFLLFFPATIIMSTVVVFCVNIIVYVWAPDFTFSELVKGQRLGYYISIIIISIFTSIAIYGFNFYKVFKESQLEKQTLIAGQATAQFESLKNQIDPHFLFNSLNVLTGLIEEDPQNAIKYTNSLSRIYRYILEQKDKKTVPITQEIIFAQNYINLLKLRFEDSITCEIAQVAIDSNGHTVPLALQLLLENCIQHNIATEESKLNIRLYIEQEYLIISNNLQEKSNKSSSTKIGLKNIIERYNLLTNKQIEIIKTDQLFTVKLPILDHYV